MKFRDSFFMYTLVVFFILLVSTAYYRFMVLHDYMVTYEGECDPMTHSCFIGCEDDECNTEYYFTHVQKYAPNLQSQCGEDITECEFASVCLPDNDEQCSIQYCKPEFDGESCETIIEDDSSNTEDITEEGNLGENI